MKSLMMLQLTTMLVIMTSQMSYAEKEDMKVEYYATASLSCGNDDPASAFKQIFWITAEAVVLDAHTTSMPHNLEWGNSDGTMLNITKLDDDMFGYYTCVMIPNGNTQPIIMRWGVNIDGADFSKLEEQYRENAVIGAIAAAVMLVLVGGACIIWHFRYSKRNSARGDGSSIEDDPKADMKYRNQAFDGGDMIETAPAAPDDKPNGTTTTTTDGTENGGYESFRM